MASFVVRLLHFIVDCLLRILHIAGFYAKLLLETLGEVRRTGEPHLVAYLGYLGAIVGKHLGGGFQSYHLYHFAGRDVGQSLNLCKEG